LLHLNRIVSVNSKRAGVVTDLKTCWMHSRQIETELNKK